jgi:hypothetical protein
MGSSSPSKSRECALTIAVKDFATTYAIIGWRRASLLVDA